VLSLPLSLSLSPQLTSIVMDATKQMTNSRESSFFMFLPPFICIHIYLQSLIAL
jgi:hypothetical protein